MVRGVPGGRHSDKLPIFPSTDLSAQDTTWMEANLFDGDSSENRIPFDVLDSTEAETVYKNLLNQLNAEQDRYE